MASFNKLPFELHHNIVQYLDNDSAKSLRLAYPTPKIIATTGATVFKTLVLRLGNHKNSRTKLDNLRSCLLTENNEIDLSTDGTLTHVRTLVVDTRYPFVVTDEFTWTRSKWRTSGHLNMPSNSRCLADCAEIVPDEELNSFLDLFTKVLSTISGRLKSLRWQTSDLLPFPVYDQIAKLLFSPMVLIQKKYEFTVSHTFATPYALTQYLKPLSSCDRLEIIGASTKSTEEEIDRIDMAAVAELISRCHGLNSFNYTYQTWVDADCFDILWGAINNLETLEELQLHTSENMIGSVKPNLSRLKRLKKISFDCSEYLLYILDGHPVYAVFDSLVTTGIDGITKLSVGVYSDNIQKLLLQQKAITDLNLHISSKADILRIFALIIPAVAGTLRCFRISGVVEGQPWGWSDKRTDGRGLLKCKKLQEIEFPFIERNFLLTGEGTVINSLPTLINDFVRSCPELIRIHTGSIAADYNVASSLINVLTDFRSMDEIFKGRDIEIMLRQHTEGEWGSSRCRTRFPRSGNEEDLVGVFDYYIHRWRLREETADDGEEKVYRFERIEDKCWMRNECWEDD
ncbi:hypothetical protein EYR41_001071 [Orbilia oligospora]|uniref:Uncharacterized protein n=1 Tax=Orbilia oligospora TaxID=2813651 RepID=A0A7C8P5Z5_ORBOL|nr:hypothetical protein TWF751_003235 [Orbilia oligospora]KAF3275481.1 hypothetical protein TWF132_002890 [Orbilia oligospora]TGJ74018.1 hypothetical protein EYR41_001071 [Orbilia oligospora]